MDRMSSIYIDYCSDCHIFLGPVEGAVFIRNCSNITLIGICQQLRTRDCEDCRFGIHIQSDPIIESSSGMRFAPFSGTYPQLEEHLHASRIAQFSNNWYKVYDFDKSIAPIPRWELLSSYAAGSFFDGCELPEQLTIPDNEIIPLILGPHVRSESRKTLAVVFPTYRRQKKQWRPKNAPPAPEPPLPPTDLSPQTLCKHLGEHPSACIIKVSTKNFEKSRLETLGWNEEQDQDIFRRCGDQMSQLAFILIESTGHADNEEAFQEDLKIWISTLFGTNVKIFDSVELIDSTLNCFFELWSD